MRPAAKPAEVRVRQAIALLVGALALELLVARGSTPFYATPLILGLSYLAAALIGGKRGGHWATACVLVGWGAAVVYFGHERPTDLDTAGVYLLGAGLGFTAGALLARVGVQVDAAGMGVTLVGAGATLAFSPQVSQLLEAQTFAIALGAVAVVNVGLALGPSGRG